MIQKRFFSVFIIISMFGFSFPNLNGQTNLYVSPSGDDSNTGAVGSPLQTLIGARDKIRSIKSSSGLPNGGIVVNFRGGTYPLNSTCHLDAEDAGTGGSPIVYRGYQNEKVIFDGNLFIDNTAFQPTTSAHASKLHSSAVDSVVYQTITAQSLIDVLRSDAAQLSMNNKMLTVARFPNIGYSHVDQSTVNASDETINGQGTFENPVGSKFRLIESYNSSKWGTEISRTKKVIASGYLSAQWLKESKYVAEEIGGYLRLKDGTAYGLIHLINENRPTRIYFSQLLCELDAPGEWYFDETDNTLYLWPSETIDATSKIGVWAGPMMVQAKNTEHIHFTHMTIQNVGGGSSVGAAIELFSGNNFLIAGVTFRNISEPMASFNCLNSVTNTTILSCDFIDTYTSRLYGGSFSSKGNIINGNNKIENCHFTRVHAKDYSNKATHISGVGNIFRNNLIHNYITEPLTHDGIDHHIEYNEFFNTGVEEGDDGAISCGQDIMSYGVEVRHNFIHHNLDVPGLFGRAGVMRDDMDGGDLIEQNIIYKGGGDAGIKMNGGAGHQVLSNVVLACGYGIQQFDGGTRFYEPTMEFINSTNGKSPTSAAKENYIGRMLQKIGVSNWTSGLNESNWYSRIEPFWLNRYPYFNIAMKAYSDNQLMNAYANNFHDNMFWSNGRGNIKQTPPISADIQRSQNVDLSIFVNPDNLNFKFKEPRPGFAPDIPFEKIGLYIDEYRRQVPVKDTYRKAVKDRFVLIPAFSSDAYDPATINDRLYYNSGAAVIATIPDTASTAPIVSFKFPFHGQEYIPGDTIKVKAYASDNSSINKVTLFFNGKLVREITSGEYEWGFSNIDADSLLRDTTEGRFFLKLIAEDDEGNTSSRNITVIIQKPEIVIPTVNTAPQKPVWQSSNQYTDGSGYAEKAVDGSTDGDFWGGASVTSTKEEYQAWWELDLEAHYTIKQINIWNRIGAENRLSNFHLFVSDVPFLSTDLEQTINQDRVRDFHITEQAKRPTIVDINEVGRYVRVQLADKNFLHLAEVEVLLLPKDTVPVDAPEVPPYAIAGNDTLIVEGSSFMLDGTASSHPFDQEITAYKWTVPEGIELNNADSIKSVITAPIVENETQFDITLTVFHNELESRSDTISITVINRPEADAGSDQTVVEGALVFLDGFTGSHHPDGKDITAYKWTYPNSITLLEEDHKPQPLFVAPETSKDTTLTFSLIVYSEEIASYPDTVLITINKKPTYIQSVQNTHTEFNVFPIPVVDEDLMIVGSKSVSEFNIELFDYYGRMIYSEVIKSNKHKISSNLLSMKGIYLLRIKYQDKCQIMKIVAQ